MYVSRLLAATLHAALEELPAVLLTGPRQSGKTTLVLHELRDQFAYATLDDPLGRSFAAEDPAGFLNQFGDTPLILDEIQYVPELLSYLKIRIDRDRRRTGRWVLTSSQQFQLMHSISESLAGRIAILELYPFSALETPETSLSDLIWGGGYPEPALHPARRDLWLKAYLQTYIERDVRQILNVGDLRAFEAFVGLCAAGHGQVFNQAAISRVVGVTQPTVKAWASVLSASYVLYLLPPYLRNYGKRLTKRPKMHFLDSALVCALTRQTGGEAALVGAMGGALFEGWVVSEVVKVLSVTGRRPELYYWRSRDGLEVDLIIPIGTKLLPVEIKLTATPMLRHAEPLREFKALAGDDALDTGLLVCRVTEQHALPGGNLALPWKAFPGWLQARLAEA